MNMDGLITITDVWSWFKWLSFYPGDYLVSLIGPTAIGRFFEMSSASYGGGLSFLVSAVVWLGLGIGVADLLNPEKRKAKKEWYEAEQERIRREDEGKSIWTKKNPPLWAFFAIVIVFYAFLMWMTIGGRF